MNKENLSIDLKDVITFTWEAGVTPKTFQIKATEGRKFTIDWGDGHSKEIIIGEGDSEITLSHTYATADDYTVRLKAKVEDCRFIYLSCTRKKMKNLSVSGCAALEELLCNNNYLRNLDIGGCIALKRLHCFENDLRTLNVSGCKALRDIRCYTNLLTDLDIYDCTALEVLMCHNNSIESIDVGGCEALTHLEVYPQLPIVIEAQGVRKKGRKIKKMNDLSKAKELIKECKNNQDSYLDLGETGVTHLDKLPELFECKHLDELTLCSNRIFDVSLLENFTGLRYLDISHNYICDISSLKELTGLEYLDLGHNHIRDIGVLEQLTKLESLSLRNNPIIDYSFLSHLTKLKSLDLRDNPFSEFDFLEGMTGLQFLYLNKDSHVDINFLKRLIGLEDLDIITDEDAIM